MPTSKGSGSTEPTKESVFGRIGNWPQSGTAKTKRGDGEPWRNNPSLDEEGSAATVATQEARCARSREAGARYPAARSRNKFRDYTQE